MPSGDAQRTWFRDMVDELRFWWHEAMSLDQLIALTGELDGMLQAIRAERNIKPPMMWCPKCQKRERSAPPRVSVRAAIFALDRFGIASPEKVASLDKLRTKYQKQNGLDSRGAPADRSKDQQRGH